MNQQKPVTETLNDTQLSAIGKIRETVTHHGDEIRRMIRVADYIRDAVASLSSAHRICQRASVTDDTMSYDAERQYRLSNVSGALHDAIGHLGNALDDVGDGNFHKFEWVEQSRIALVDIAHDVDGRRTVGIREFNRINAVIYSLSANAYRIQSVALMHVNDLAYVIDRNLSAIEEVE